MRKVVRRKSQRELHKLRAVCRRAEEDHLGAGLMSHGRRRYRQKEAGKYFDIFKKGGTASHRPFVIN